MSDRFTLAINLIAESLKNREQEFWSKTPDCSHD